VLSERTRPSARPLSAEPDLTVWTVVVAAGSGERFGQRKQYESLGERRVLDWSLVTAAEMTAGVVVVVPKELADRAEPLADATVAGGSTRSASVRAGLAAVPAAATHVLVHDAARPVPLANVWQRVLGALADGAEVVVPVVAVTDTLREREGGTVDRSRFVAVQTPQGFRIDVLQRAHEQETDATDDASLAEAAGAKVSTVDGDPRNIKITEPWHLAIAELLIP
jgi:2-C-methyl-D-erythritol 4-phosphate cytidylyltransferase